MSGSRTISTDVSTPEKTRLPRKILLGFGDEHRDEDRGSHRRLRRRHPPLARVQAKESVGLSTGRWNANPCENNRLIPNPSPWVLGSGRGGEFEGRALSLNRSGLIWPGGWSLPGPVTNVEFGKGSHANWILVPRPRSLLLRCNFGLDGRGGRRRRGKGR